MTSPRPAVPTAPAARSRIPRLADDYTAAAARQRMAFLTDATGASPEHIGRYSFDPAVVAGNIENFVGVA
jgi:hydroxymethylglutaryl-CoA reductase (NADPH)